MKRSIRFIANALFFAAVAIAALAQTATPPLPGPVTYVTQAEYDQLLQEGKIIPVNASVIAQQNTLAEETYEKNLAVVQAYLNAHPNLTGLAQLVNTVPDTAPGNPNGMIAWPNGEYQVPIVDKLGRKHSVQLLGQREKIAEIAGAIQAASDPTTQLQVYTAVFEKIPQSYLNTDAGRDLIQPSQLQGASLATIQGALKQVAKQADKIIQTIPFAGTIPAASCADEVGAGDAPQTTWGDRTYSAGCTTPSKTGIIGNFNFPGKSQLSCVKEQGERGTCHIFAATSALEQVVARDLGKHVNLSEQDFQEHLKLLWTPAFFNDGGDAGYDLIYAFLNNYPFAYEDQWAYNPSWLQPISPKVFEYQNTCANGYPSSEPGCSESAPQSPGICVIDKPICALAPALVLGSTHYKALPPLPIPIVPEDWDVTIGTMKIFFSAQSPIMMGFTATYNYEYGAPGGFIEYQPSDLYNQKTILGGHMVHVVGYLSNTDLLKKIPTAPPGAGGGYFIIKNSWGACDGDAGYKYMPVDYFEAEVWDLWTLPAIVD